MTHQAASQRAVPAGGSGGGDRMSKTHPSSGLAEKTFEKDFYESGVKLLQMVHSCLLGLAGARIML